MEHTHDEHDHEGRVFEAIDSALHCGIDAETILDTVGAVLGIYWANHAERTGYSYTAAGVSAHRDGNEVPRFNDDDDFELTTALTASFYSEVQEATGARAYFDEEWDESAYERFRAWSTRFVGGEVEVEGGGKIVTRYGQPPLVEIMATENGENIATYVAPEETIEVWVGGEVALLGREDALTVCESLTEWANEGAA